mmetsp:Transcript_15317/g.40472  ORF Transcript_15317/g.40472 Transcript_15317/m.40472 type:complete len:105 (+) Transcript_15317:445-759(+)
MKIGASDRRRRWVIPSRRHSSHLPLTMKPKPFRESNHLHVPVTRSAESLKKASGVRRNGMEVGAGAMCGTRMATGTALRIEDESACENMIGRQHGSCKEEGASE